MPSRSAAVLLGTVAGLALLASWYLLARAIDAVFIPDAIATTLVRDTPGGLATWMLEEWGRNASRLARGIGVVLVPMAFIGLAWVRPQGWTPRAAGLMATVMSVVGLLLAARTPDTRVTLGAALFIVLAAWGVLALLGMRLRELRQIDDEVRTQRSLATSWLDGPGDAYRRAFLLRTAALGGALALTAAGGGSWIGRWRTPPETLAGQPLPLVRAVLAGTATPMASTGTSATAPQPFALPDNGFAVPPTVRQRLTPNDEFYVVDVSLRDPVIPEDTWTLKVRGLVERELTLTYADLLARPARDLPGTLRCISYTYGNDLMSTTVWTGTSLADVLREAGVQGTAEDVVLRGAGGYTDSIPIDAALGADVLLAYAMQGETLSISHGFPCRVFVPNLYGEKNVKWLHTIDVVASDYLGYWQERGWTDTAILNVLSAVDLPVDARVDVTADGAEIGGIAFAGTRGIARVEVRVGNDDAGAWEVADVEPYVPELVWQRWKLLLLLSAVEGRDEIVVTVRAFDELGEGQDPQPRNPHPDGLTGLHEMRLPLRRAG